ncbi:MAG: sugar phosphate isomerase/epimerase [Candidatus Aenigmarchaeota archaeon]|nr:sugar phosphate isomerase/epimerase [Candidatus Aenigmarchaeota archaeon]
MTIKFGMITNPANDILEEINSILKLGFDYAELGIEMPGGSPEVVHRNSHKIRNLVKEFKFPPLAHTAWWIDFGGGYDLVREVWIREANKSIDAAELLGIKKINFHLYSIGLVEEYKPYHKLIVDNIVKSLREVARYANSKNIMVMLENSNQQKKSVVDIKDYKFVIDSVPNLKVHLDIGHAFIENGMDGIKDYIFMFKNKLEHIHMHDNHGKWDEHLPLGKGKINFEQTAKWLKQIGYDKTITFEVFTSKKDAKDSMIKFRKMLS